MNTCTVYVRAKDGHFILGHVTAANSVFEAARNGLAWFEDASHGKAHPQTTTRFWKSDQSLTIPTSTMRALVGYGRR